MSTTQHIASVVIDTNILISSLITRESFPALLYDLATQGILKWYVSEAILTEYRRVLLYKKFSKYFSQTEARQVFESIKTHSTKVDAITLPQLTDETDTKFLECAVSAKVDYLVTGNLKHFPKAYQGVKVVSPTEFVNVIADTLKL